MSAHADRHGRRWMLVLASLLIVGAGPIFILTDRFVLLLVAATFGVPGTARSMGASVAPAFSGHLLGNPAAMGGSFFIAGAVTLTLAIHFHVLRSGLFAESEGWARLRTRPLPHPSGGSGIVSATATAMRGSRQRSGVMRSVRDRGTGSRG